MTQTLETKPLLNKIDFKEYDWAKNVPLSRLVKDYHVVYVTSITRDGCSGCEEQKPLFQKLAQKVEKEYPGKTSFSNIHIRYVEDDPGQSEEAKSLFGHGSYPTYMLHVKSRHGLLELYRAAYPSMEELEKQIVDAFDLADFYGKDAEKTQ
jgi:thiol-disulfide isomerase/thioredoxin